MLVRGPQVMKGYLKNPEATNSTVKDGWLFTGSTQLHYLYCASLPYKYNVPYFLFPYFYIWTYFIHMVPYFVLHWVLLSHFILLSLHLQYCLLS